MGTDALQLWLALSKTAGKHFIVADMRRECQSIGSLLSVDRISLQSRHPMRLQAPIQYMKVF